MAEQLLNAMGSPEARRPAEVWSPLPHSSFFLEDPSPTAIQADTMAVRAFVASQTNRIPNEGRPSMPPHPPKQPRTPPSQRGWGDSSRGGLSPTQSRHGSPRDNLFLSGSGTMGVIAPQGSTHPGRGRQHSFAPFSKKKPVRAPRKRQRTLK